jgi:hypothetical protein
MPPTSAEQIPGDCLNPYNAGPSFDCGDRQLGTTSPAQGFALGVSGETLTPRISVSGDYAQSNNCHRRCRLVLCRSSRAV